ncbi:oxidoreductase [Xylariaceae sp. FL0255]|nr:oxidoreductase [Xylariaceae sp. FL0255]
MPKHNTDILIIGNGIAGPTLATFLLMGSTTYRSTAEQRGGNKPLRITVLERSVTPYSYGTNVDIRGAGVGVIRNLGLETAIRASTTGEEGVRIVDRENRIVGEIPADKSGKTSMPTSDIEIMRGRLAELLYARSKDVNDKMIEAAGGDRTRVSTVEYIFGDRVESIAQDEEKVHVRLAKGGDKMFDLVVGADGLQSQTRKMVFGEEGEEDRVKRLGMYTAFFTMPKGPTDSLWRRWFHAPGRRSIMQRPGQQTRDGRVERSTVLVSVVNDEDKRFRDVAGRRGVSQQKALLKEYFIDAGWESERIIKGMETANDFYYDMVAQVKMDTWSKGRIVLLGDAGYCASPISGMGTTLGLTGGYTLAGALTRHPDDHAAAFALYQQQMQPTVAKAQKLAPGMPHMMHPETEWGVWTLHSFIWFIRWSGIQHVMFKMGFGPPAHSVSVEDYGFEGLPDWKEWRAAVSE